ncbi:hypothetical protein NIES2104_53320 [Leptolyngbya sp. NIES-2104]|nr:hypothetical protein NIES2104_53320 [Leptolyngbya sp. NIES-2104]
MRFFKFNCAIGKLAYFEIPRFVHSRLGMEFGARRNRSGKTCRTSVNQTAK